jgi:hypothetical protein
MAYNQINDVLVNELLFLYKYGLSNEDLELVYLLLAMCPDDEKGGLLCVPDEHVGTRMARQADGSFRQERAYTYVPLSSEGIAAMAGVKESRIDMIIEKLIAAGHMQKGFVRDRSSIKMVLYFRSSLDYQWAEVETWWPPILTFK